jgi:hypothetical protein
LHHRPNKYQKKKKKKQHYFRKPPNIRFNHYTPEPIYRDTPHRYQTTTENAVHEYDYNYDYHDYDDDDDYPYEEPVLQQYTTPAPHHYHSSSAKPPHSHSYNSHTTHVPFYHSSTPYTLKLHDVPHNPVSPHHSSKLEFLDDNVPYEEPVLQQYKTPAPHHYHSSSAKPPHSHSYSSHTTHAPFYHSSTPFTLKLHNVPHNPVSPHHSSKLEFLDDDVPYNPVAPHHSSKLKLLDNDDYHGHPYAAAVSKQPPFYIPDLDGVAKDSDWDVKDFGSWGRRLRPRKRQT